MNASALLSPSLPSVRVCSARRTAADAATCRRIDGETPVAGPNRTPGSRAPRRLSVYRPPMDERAIHHRASPARLADREGEVTVVSMKKAIAFIEATDRFEDRPAQGEAHAVHRRHFGHGTFERRAPGQGVNDASPGIAAVGADFPGAVEPG